MSFDPYRALEEGDRYRVETPEQIGLEYDIAGLGTRFLAALIDTLLLGALLMLVLCLGLFGITAAITPLAGEDNAAIWAFALIGLLLFAILWGYYVFFETVWQGQSPGKRWTGLRVLRDGGYPIGFPQAALRNVVRLVDFLPVSYAIGATVMLIDRRSRRLGDLVAGTIVVKEPQELTLDTIGGGASPTPLPVTQPGWPAGFGQPLADAHPIPNLERLTPDDQSLLREYFARRRTLSNEVAARLALRMATAFARKLDYAPSGDIPEQFLARIVRELSVRASSNRT